MDGKILKVIISLILFFIITICFSVIFAEDIETNPVELMNEVSERFIPYEEHFYLEFYQAAIISLIGIILSTFAILITNKTYINNTKKAILKAISVIVAFAVIVISMGIYCQWSTGGVIIRTIVVNIMLLYVLAVAIILTIIFIIKGIKGVRNKSKRMKDITIFTYIIILGILYMMFLFSRPIWYYLMIKF